VPHLLVKTLALRRRVWAVAALLGLACGCRPRQVDECATVQARMLEELRLTDGAHDGLGDAESVARHAQRLRAFSAGLRALELRDADLRAAVERYHASIDGLAEAYAGIALPQAPGDGGVDGGDGERGLVTLGAVLSTHGAALNGARSAISRACAGR
jgi:hypothetical protein